MYCTFSTLMMMVANVRHGHGLYVLCKFRPCVLIVRLFFLLLDLHDVKKGDLIKVHRYVHLVISGTCLCLKGAATQKKVGLNEEEELKLGGFQAVDK